MSNLVAQQSRREPMKSNACRDCGKSLPARARGCRNCARNLDAERMLAKYFLSVMVLALLLLAGCGLFLYLRA